MPFASLPTGIEMYYEVEGSGDPLLLIMGTNADHTTWAAQVEAYRHRYTVVTFDATTDVPGGLGSLSQAAFLAPGVPNPFAGTTSVSFVVPATGPVSLEVFDVTGRRVVKLVDRDLASGSHTATWDGRDATGSRVASGVYLYRLSAGGESVAKEMVLRK